MARSPRFSPRHQQSNRRMFDWIGGGNDVPESTVALANATSVIALAFDTRVASQVPVAPFTITRVRGYLEIHSDQTIAQEGPLGAYGIAVVNGEAFDAGVASIPTPWTESFDDRWLYHTYWDAFFMENPTTSDYQQIPFIHVIDGKAMRKVNFGDVIVAVMENASNQGCNFFMNFRMGVKLH